MFSKLLNFFLSILSKEERKSYRSYVRSNYSNIEKHQSEVRVPLLNAEKITEYSKIHILEHEWLTVTR